MSSSGMPRWIRSNPTVDERESKCYSALLESLIAAANAATAECLECSLYARCRVSTPPDVAVGCPRS